MTTAPRRLIGPFVTSAELVSSSGGVIAVMASLREEGRRHEVATAFTGWSRVPAS